MKKYFILVLILFTFLFGCTKKDSNVYKVMLPSGTPLLAVGDLLDDDNFDFEIVNGQDPLSAAFISGECDMIIAPLNLGAKLFLAGNSDYKLDAIITTNNTYLISKSELSINDLSNKKILAYGAGSSPYIALKAALDINSVTATIETQSSVADVSNIFAAGTGDYTAYLSAEPNITILKEKGDLSFYTIDISELIKDEASVLIQACLFVNANSSVSSYVLEKIKNNIESMNENPDEYAQKIENKEVYFTTLGLNVIKKAIPNSNITYLKANENKTIITEYFTLLNKYNPNILQGKTPDESFYN